MFGAVVSQVKALDNAISGKVAGSSQKALDVDDTSPIALLALESPPVQPYRTPRRHTPPSLGPRYESFHGISQVPL